MPTDVQALKAKLLAERQLLVDQVALIDMVDEQAKFDAAATQLANAQAVFQKKSERWTQMNAPVRRLKDLDDQLALLGP